MSTPGAGAPGTNTGQPGGDQGATPPAPTGQQNPPAPSPDPAPTGDLAKVQAALTKERELRKSAEKSAKDNADAKTRLDELEQASKSDTEKAVAAARKEGATEAITKAHRLLVGAEARAVAAELRFQDPRDVALIDLSDVRVAEDGTVDTAVITERLGQLAKDKPYLVAAAAPPPPPGPRPPMPDPSQGSGRQPAPTAGTRGAAEAARRFGQPAAAGTTN